MASPGPLHGLRVVEAASMIAGPYAAALLGDLGADVIKVEAPLGDELRRLGPAKDGEPGSFLAINRSKRGIALDLAQEEGREAMRRLLRTAHVFITNLQEPSLSRLGLAYEQVKAIRPDIVWVGVTAYGPHGPYAGRPGIDALAQALAGMAYLHGDPGGGPVRVPVVDVAISLLAVIGVLTALYQRVLTGQGQRVDVCLLDAAAHLNATAIVNYLVTGWLHPRVGNASPYLAPSGIYRCRDGTQVFASCPNDRFFRRLCQALDVALDKEPDFATAEARMRNAARLDEALQTAFLRWDGDQSVARAAAGAIVAPVATLPQVTQDPQIRHNGMITTTYHPTLGPIEVTGVPLGLSGATAAVRRGAPPLGHHTEEVLTELGYSRAQIEELARRGVVKVGRS